jgi:hypothetical protein
MITLTFRTLLILLIEDEPWTSLVDMSRGTMTVALRQGMLFLHVITYLPYSATSRPYVRVRRNSGTSIGTGAHSQGQDGRTTGGPSRDVNI